MLIHAAAVDLPPLLLLPLVWKEKESGRISLRSVCSSSKKRGTWDRGVRITFVLLLLPLQLPLLFLLLVDVLFWVFPSSICVSFLAR